MQQLSGLDASFLSLETPTAPMHIAGVSILGSRCADGERMNLERLRTFVASRLHTTRTFRQRLAEVPLDLGRPYWIDDAEFDLDRHIERTTLPAPGGWHELSALMAWELSQALPRDRPLWQMILVEGLEQVPGVPAGSLALIGKVHHAAIDGVSGAEILSALFDPDPNATAEPSEVRDSAPDTEPDHDRKPPSALGLLGRTGRNLLRQPKALGSTVGGAVKGLARAGTAWGIERVKPPPMPFSAPRTVLNHAVSKDHVWSGAVLDLAKIRAIKDAARAAAPEDGPRPTVNDIVLATCAGALRRYLERREAAPEDSLVAMVPVSVRAEDEKGSMGNQVSAMLVQLATDEPDPVHRLQRIAEGTARAKHHHKAIGARTLTDAAQIIPFSLAGRAAVLYTRFGVAERHRPIFNVVITNVPGPQIPLYVDGAPLLHHFGAAPIFDGMGLTLAVFSYHGQITVGICSCRTLMPDASVFADDVRDALAELGETFG